MHADRWLQPSIDDPVHVMRTESAAGTRRQVHLVEPRRLAVHCVLRQPPPGATPDPGAAGDGAVPLDIRAVADLIPAARAARVALAASGRVLSRDALADRMRDDGHGVSNARRSLLVKILKAEDGVTPFGPVPARTTGDDADERPGVVA
jgi:hypothetical protein